MKIQIRLLLMLVLGLSCLIQAHSYDFKVNGIYYSKLNNSNNAVKITALYEGRHTANKAAYSGSVTIPHSVTYGGKTYKVTSIGNAAFFYCRDLRSVVIPASVTVIGPYAFYNCTGLSSVTIANSVTSIGADSFFSCTSLQSVAIPNSVTRIGSRAFADCENLRNISMSESVSEIGGEAFRGTPWFRNQPNGPVYAGKVLYIYKGVMPANTSLTIRPGTLGIASSALTSCKGLISVSIPNSVIYIGTHAFAYCERLSSITIPNSVKAILSTTFQWCKGLQSVSLGADIASIDSYAFSQCTNIRSIILLNPTPPTIGKQDVFYNVPRVCSVYVPSGSIEAYRNAPGWNYFSNFKAR